MNIVQDLTIPGNGLYAAQTLQADFLRGSPSYLPDADPRLPLHDTLDGNLTIWSNASIKVSNIGLFPEPAVGDNIYGAVRIGGEVILYADRFTSNSTLATLTRNVANTINCTISGNLKAGNLVSVLGLRTVNS